MTDCKKVRHLFYYCQRSILRLRNNSLWTRSQDKLFWGCNNNKINHYWFLFGSRVHSSLFHLQNINVIVEYLWKGLFWIKINLKKFKKILIKAYLLNYIYNLYQNEARWKQNEIALSINSHFCILTFMLISKNVP